MSIWKSPRSNWFSSRKYEGKRTAEGAVPIALLAAGDYIARVVFSVDLRHDDDEIVRRLGDLVGKLFLADDDPQRVRAYATRTGLSGHTKNSITQLPILERELAKVRQYSTAHDNEELELGVHCMASGIYDDQGKLVAGLSISAPTGRLDKEWLPKLQAVTTEISRILGYQPGAKRPSPARQDGR